MTGTDPSGQQSPAWIVTVTREAMGNMDSMRTSVEAHGFTVHTVLSSLGQMSGRAPESAVAEVKALPGISAVDADTSVGVAPPDDEVQ